MQPTVIELFAGGGGAATGLWKAGYKHLVSVEMWQPAVDTLRAVGFPTIAGRVEEANLSKFKDYMSNFESGRGAPLGAAVVLWSDPSKPREDVIADGWHRFHQHYAARKPLTIVWSEEMR